MLGKSEKPNKSFLHSLEHFLWNKKDISTRNDAKTCLDAVEIEVKNMESLHACDVVKIATQYQIDFVKLCHHKAVLGKDKQQKMYGLFRCQRIQAGADFSKTFSQSLHLYTLLIAFGYCAAMAS